MECLPLSRNLPADERGKKMAMPELSKDSCSYKDSELVAEARAGNREAFSVLINRHHRTCVNIASFILRDRSDAQDEVQKACFKAFEHLDQYHGDAEFLTWLLRIVSNQCLMLIRVRRRVRYVYIDADTDRERSMPIELPSVAANPEGELINQEMHEVLQREVRRIPPLLRNVLILRDVEELPMADVAARLQITLPAAKSRLLRARIELRERVKRHCSGGAQRKSRPVDSSRVIPIDAKRPLKLPATIRQNEPAASENFNAAAPAWASLRRGPGYDGLRAGSWFVPNNVGLQGPRQATGA
jgi:RNA polymerase sigma-70 factor (ECF subfamily)